MELHEKLKIKGELLELAEKIYIRTISNIISDNYIKDNNDFVIDNADTIWEECVSCASLCYFNREYAFEKQIKHLIDENQSC